MRHENNILFSCALELLKRSAATAVWCSISLKNQQVAFAHPNELWHGLPHIQILHFIPLARGSVPDMAPVGSLLKWIPLRPLATHLYWYVMSYVGDKVILVSKEIRQASGHK